MGWGSKRRVSPGILAGQREERCCSPGAWLLDSVPEKSFPGPGVFSNTLPLCTVTPASPGPCTFAVMEKEEQGLLGLDTAAQLSNNVQSASSIYCNFHLNCLSGSMYWYKCFH